MYTTKTNFNKNDKNNFEKVSKLPSETEPNQAYTPAQLLKMHAQGLTPAIQKQTFYEEEEFGEEINPFRKQNFDLSDLDEIRDDLTNLHTEYRKQKDNENLIAKNKFKQEIINEYKLSLTKKQDGKTDKQESAKKD